MTKLLVGIVCIYTFAWALVTPVGWCHDVSGLAVTRSSQVELSDTSDPLAIFPALLKEARIPGLQIALIRAGKIVQHENYGVKNAVTGEPVTDDTIFEAASLTKPLFAYYAMMLVDQGILNLDKPLASYISSAVAEKFLDHPLTEKGFHRDWFESITMRHILSHTSGMPHGEQGTPFPLYFQPGTKWKYSATGYSLLQRVIETLKGDKLENLMQKEVLEPLGMIRSSLVWREVYNQTMANGHDFFSAPAEFRKRTVAQAASSLYTTAEDYARFVCAVLNGHGLRPETVKEMLAIQTTQDESSKEPNALGWSLGFGTQNVPGRFAIWQWGDFDIFRNFIMAFPQEKKAVIYLTNSYNGLGICADVIARCVGVESNGLIASMYKSYTSPICQVGWGLAENGVNAANDFPDLAKKHPDVFTVDSCEFLKQSYQAADKLPVLLPLLRYSSGMHPESGSLRFTLAEILVQAGNYRTALNCFARSGRAKIDKVQPGVLDWSMKHVQALIKPSKLSKNHLQKLAGVYGARHLEFKNGRLYYHLEGGSSPEPKLLYAMSKDLFVFARRSDFRLQIGFDEQGNPVKAIGIYLDGSRDEMIRRAKGTVALEQCH